MKSPDVNSIVDPFLDFALRFLDRDRPDSWVVHAGSPAYVAWRGNAFELACLAHIPQIKSALGISDVETTCVPWRCSSEGRGAQIDLVIDRRDGIVDLCETKFTDAPFVLGSDELERMVRRREAFRDETGTSKALHLVLICAAGVAAGKHLSSVQAVVTGDDLFAQAVLQTFGPSIVKLGVECLALPQLGLEEGARDVTPGRPLCCEFSLSA